MNEKVTIPPPAEIYFTMDELRFLRRLAIEGRPDFLRQDEVDSIVRKIDLRLGPQRR